ncbi:hypothetical protein ASPZODRAFT_73663, partial [Penicilliopsis zonata CBS 506.65]
MNSIEVDEDPTENDFSLRLDGPSHSMEKIQDYKPGGHHPVHIKDCLGGKGEEERYYVMNKLATGHSSNVWLCRDLDYEVPREGELVDPTTLTAAPHRYVALKILRGDAFHTGQGEADMVRDPMTPLAPDDQLLSKYLCFPFAAFLIEGPNGNHRCFVYPLLGPRVSSVIRMLPAPERALKVICNQAVLALDTMHR